MYTYVCAASICNACVCVSVYNIYIHFVWSCSNKSNVGWKQESKEQENECVTQCWNTGVRAASVSPLLVLRLPLFLFPIHSCIQAHVRRVCVWESEIETTTWVRSWFEWVINRCCCCRCCVNIFCFWPLQIANFAPADNFAVNCYCYCCYVSCIYQLKHALTTTSQLTKRCTARERERERATELVRVSALNVPVCVCVWMALFAAVLNQIRQKVC